MKMIPMILSDQKADRNKVEVITDVSFLGLKVLNGREGDVGVLSLLFMLSTKQGEQDAGTAEDNYYVQQMFMFDDEDEKNLYARSPYNIANFDGELEETYNELIKGIDPKTGIWGTNFIFSIDEREFTKYYKFEAKVFNKETKKDTITEFICTRRVWVILYQLEYWVMMGYPINTSIFSDNRYEHIKVCDVTGLIFDASTVMEVEGEKINLAHFEIYYKDGINNGIYHMNVMTQEEQGKLLKNAISNEEYQKRYEKTDTFTPMRSFIINTPKKGFAVLGMEPIINGFKLLLVDEEVTKRTNWLDWNKHIYLNMEEN